MKEKHPDASNMLLAWPMNNYWNTNFRASQPGFIRLRYEMTSFSAFNPAKCSRFAQASMLPFEWHPLVNDCEIKRERLVEITGGHNMVQLLQMKRSEDEKGIVERIYNHSEELESVQISLPEAQITKAFLCDLLETRAEDLVVKNSKIDLKISSRGVVSIYIL